jgi:DNA-binding beta-propeller fold protein YncE
MSARGLLLAAVIAAAWGLLAACGSSGRTLVSSRAAVEQIDAPAEASASGGELFDWPEFGLDPQRSDTTAQPSGVTAAGLAHMHRTSVRLPGTVDSSPIYLHGVSVAGALHNVIVVTTTYGRTLAIDADSGRTLWTFTPPGFGTWAGTAQITTTSPLADPDRTHIYAASPNGLVHKLSLASGTEDRGGAWPARVTLEPRHEKLAAALNIDGSDLLVATGGYFGDAPPYQGHLVLLDRSSGRRIGVFNTLCGGRRDLQVPSTCPASDSAILSRAGPVVEPGGGRILLDTGNGPWNGSNDFGDSVLEVSFPHLRLRQSFTPTDQATLNSTDTDLGSSGPALLGHDRIVVAGKDGVMRVLELSRLNGHPPGSAGSLRHLGGEVQRLSIPGGGQLFTAPAVWSHGGHTTMFVADENATGAYVVRSGRLYRAWQNSTPGTSPVLAGGLLYVYDPDAGGIDVYHPSSGNPIAHLPGSPGHWNSPIVADGHIVEPEGNANDHLLTGSLEIFSTR